MEKTQAGLYKLTLYENKSFSVLYDSSGNISTISNTGDVLEFNINDNIPTFKNALTSAKNNNILNSYSINFMINGLDEIENVEKINNSIYGWVPLLEFMDNQTKLINSPFFSVVSVVDTNLSHTFKIELKPRRTIIQEAEDVSIVPIKNGLLYNWYAASAGLFPTDWNLPSKAQYNALSTQLGGNSVSGGKMKEVSAEFWTNQNILDDNSSKFTARGSGLRNPAFFLLKSNGFFWTSDNVGTGASYVLLSASSISYTALDSRDKLIGASVRGIYTGVGAPESTLTGVDGTLYDVIQIGSQYWTQQNWKETKLNDGTPIPNVTDETDWNNLVTPGRCSYNNDDSNI